MRKLSKINESVFGKVVKRSEGVEERTEDSAALQNKLDDFISRHLRFEKDFYIENNKVYCKKTLAIFNDDLIDGKLPFRFGEFKYSFYCSSCPSLTSLEGCPQKVGRDFNCSYCDNLTSLEGCPQEVGRDFSCSSCVSLTSLEGAPQEVGREFDCFYCDSLTSLEGCPKEIGSNFDCKKCGKKFSKNDLPEGTIIKGIFFN